MVTAASVLRQYTRPFVKSVLFGGLAGAAPMLTLTVPLGIYSLVNGSPISGVLLCLLVAIFPLIVSVPVVFISIVLFGFPLTLLLKRLQWERASVYISVGAGMGLLLCTTFLTSWKDSSSYWMSIFGALGGGVTGGTWWVHGRRTHVH